MKKVSLFVDGANIYFAQKDCRFMIDWEKVLDHFSGIGALYETFYYLGELIPPVGRTEQFVKLLHHLKFIVRRKRVKTVFQDDGSRKLKANLDIEIAMDMFNTIDNYDTAVLFSGDGDFERAIELIRTRGKEIYIVSCDNFIAWELKNAAGRNYINFTQMPQWKLRDWIDKPKS